MKKILILSLLIASAKILNAQQFVSDTRQTRNVLLEHFVGMSSDSTAVCDAEMSWLQGVHENKVFIINTHAGNLATYQGNPALQTTIGNNYYTFLNGNSIYGLSTLSRMFYSGAYLMGRVEWQTKSNSIVSQDAKVNIAPRCTIDVDTREMKLHAQLYYRVNGSGSTDRLYVSIIQNNIIAPLANAHKNASQDMGNGMYKYNNVLRHMLTPIEGESISPITSGSLLNKYYTYTLPTSIGNAVGEYGSAPLVIEDLDFLVYVVDSITTLEQVEKAKITYISNQANRIFLNEVVDVEANTNYCGSLGKLRLNISNIGTNNVSSLSGYYTLNSGIAIPFTKSFNPLVTQQQFEFMLNDIALESGINKVTIVIDKVNNTSISPISRNIQMSRPIDVQHTATIADLNIIYDYMGEFKNFIIKDLYTNRVLLDISPDNVSDNDTEDFQFPIESGHCYELRIVDATGDGFHYNTQGPSIKIGNETILERTNANHFIREFSFRFTYNGYEAVAINETNALATQVQLYPNPNRGFFTIELSLEKAAKMQIQVINTLGQMVQNPKTENLQEGANLVELQVNDLTNGLYFVRLANENGHMILPFILNK